MRMATQAEIPIQPVDKPILCSPYAEPDQHWVYDRSTGIPRKEPGRRPASYWYQDRAHRQRAAVAGLHGARKNATTCRW